MKEAKEGVSGSRRSEFEMRKSGWSREGGGPQGGSKVDGIEGVRDLGVIWSRALRQRLRHRSPST